MTVRDEVVWGAERLRRADVGDERMTASLLLARALGVDRAHVIAYPERKLAPDERERYRSWVERRAAREPFQYIVGSQEFYGFDFEVTPDVLIPRPETEAIVEAAEWLWGRRNGGTVVDVGTGSGALAVTLAKRLRGARVVATDISAGALAVARRNAARHGVGVEFVRTDLLDGLAGPFDLVVSNPPYVPNADVETLQPEVRDFEPHLALAGGSDGLDPYRRLFADLPRVLAPGAHAVVEFGIGQSEGLAGVARSSGLDVIEVLKDLQSIPRTMVLAAGPDETRGR